MSKSVSISPTTGNTSGQCWYTHALAAPMQIKGTLGQIYWVDALNSVAATSFLQFFFLPVNLVVLGVTIPDFVMAVPTNGVLPTQQYTAPVPFGDTAVRNGVPVKGSGLTVASTTDWNNATVVAMGVSIIYM